MDLFEKPVDSGLGVGIMVPVCRIRPSPVTVTKPHAGSNAAAFSWQI